MVKILKTQTTTTHISISALLGTILLNVQKETTTTTASSSSYEGQSRVQRIEKLHKKLVVGKNSSFENFDAYKASLIKRVKVVGKGTTTMTSKKMPADGEIERNNQDDVDDDVGDYVNDWIASFTKQLDECYDELKPKFRLAEPTTFLQYCLQAVLEPLF